MMLLRCFFLCLVGATAEFGTLALRDALVVQSTIDGWIVTIVESAPGTEP